ncbi:MAG: RsmF rRNA methyltransferase first C-terminal domain-containing protein [Chitinophagaceae bacterium]|nr:RsmF rRNA methyltransferase first C-terminal domain-containing protein [Chitinophagaceae bacterium]
MKLPVELILSLQKVDGFSENDFISVHSSGEQVTSVRINPEKMPSGELTHHSPFTSKSPIPWTELGYYLESRPSFTFDPLFHAGCYYVQEASSMFLEQALKQTIDLSKTIKVLDLCAAPGGKSTHIQSLISKDSLLVSNEVIRSRANILKDNIIKWGCKNVVVTNNDPAHFSKLENYFDVIVVDAPCSGSGLFRRDIDAIAEWSENNAQFCSQRQQRIIADVWPALKKDGVLIYSTCSYSEQEDEEIVKWVEESLPAERFSLQVNPDWNIIESSGGYRFWPDKLKGEGFFLSCCKKKDGGAPSMRIRKKPESVTKNDLAVISKWIKTEGKRFIKNQQTVYAWPEVNADDFSYLLQELKVIYSGVLTGELVRDKLVPAHSLAMNMSNCVAGIRVIELTKEDAIKYLQRKDINPAETNKGWNLVVFQGHPLGWVNVLPNRINNYYPKELRILKDI